jgi:hypothetical protein
VFAAPRLFLVGGRPRLLAPSLTELFLELSSLSCGDDALDADGVENVESFCKYFGFFNKWNFFSVVAFGGLPRLLTPRPDIFYALIIDFMYFKLNLIKKFCLYYD